MATVRTRFAPSPTGFLHVGGARTALFNWLFARRHQGRFVLRVEDTDAARNTEEARAAIFDGLRWLGLAWDEGPEAGGDHGPYEQSLRRDRHDEWFAQLEATGRLYEDDGAWRFRFQRREVTVDDMVAGPVTIDYRDAANTPDMVVRRSDGSYVFHFVNVVDDLDMEISHVIRGDDHLANTHKHVQLIEALGGKPPTYAHLPLILNPNGSKMSKRDAGAAVRSYVDEGFLPTGVVNFLALLGWSPKDDREVFPVEELVERFDPAGINRKAAVFDLEKCRWFSGQHLQARPIEEVEKQARPHLEAAGLPTDDTVANREIISLVREKIRTLSELPEWFAYFTNDTRAPDEAATKKADTLEDLAALAHALAAALDLISPADWEEESVDAAVKNLASERGVKPGKLLFPLRLLTTGRAGGPDLKPLLAWIGKERTLQRIRHYAAVFAA